ncbi:dihydroxy-acid dehydratase [Fusobacterium simiae]|uniref:Dihydroxy-acid dehydratase n=1 Tax=Fusobacterium simiae TaxID=855 RepID=A0ABT4DJE6_FUSSI|nr:dihydroxy-acid dehydratase [Fusobacterium simiae]MCY7008588.1 dihydroxy-acid dehydratase [Fusobacterium simiae]
MKQGKRSQKILEGLGEQYYRATLKSMGYTTDDLKRPIIGIANSWNEIVPGHFNLRQVSQRVRDGIYRAGGTPVEFGTIVLCDGVAQGHNGMHYILPSREIICDSVEAFAEAHLLDAIVLLGSCDKIVPGMLMAAARLDIPCILLPSGPMDGGIIFDGRQSDQTSSAEAYGMLSAKKITKKEYITLETLSCPTCGSCSYLGTANTMCCISEALGMTLPFGGTIPATVAARLAIAEETGKKIVELVEKNITARKIITNGSIRNAIKLCLAISGSTNAVMHITAIAHEAKLNINVLEEFDKLSRVTPHIAKINPSSKYNMIDFYKAGGVYKVLKELSAVLDKEVMTVTAKTMGENIEDITFLYPENKEVIKTYNEPFGYQGGVAVLRGNLAPNTGITKPGAFDKSLYHFIGEAICFDSEEEAEEAILEGKIKDGHVVVIRYEGPKGGPGMREMFKAMKYLYGRGLGKTTALITDGRFSGTNNGCFVGHISPEAAEGGPIAVIENGDKIEIDIDNRKINLLIPDKIIEERLKNWKRPKPKFTTGYLALYSKLASSGAEGAILKYENFDKNK